MPGWRGERRARLLAVAGDDVERAGRQAGLQRELADAQALSQASSPGLSTAALPMASAAPTLRPRICIG